MAAKSHRQQRILALAIALGFLAPALPVCAAADEIHYIDAPPDMSAAMLNAFNQGNVCARAGDYKKASQLFAQVCQSMPSFVPAHNSYAKCLMETGNLEAALSEFRLAEALSPTDNVTLRYIGDVYWHLGQLDLAVEKLRKFLQVYPKDANVGVVKAAINSILKEKARAAGAVSSRGKDNYLDEVVHLGCARWSAARMPVPVYIELGAGVAGYRDSMPKLLEQAFAEWTEATGGRVTFTFMNPSQAAVICKWVPDASRLADPNECGQATPMLSPTGEVLTCTISIVTMHKGGHTPYSDREIYDTCLHEIGHALGLRGHSSDPHDVMFNLAPAAPLGHLSARDRKTALLLYDADDSFVSEHPLRRIKYTVSQSDEAQPERASVLSAEGTRQFEAGNYEDALAKYREALELSPGASEIYVNMGSTYITMAKQDLRWGVLPAAEEHTRQGVDCYIKGHRQDLALTYYPGLIRLCERNGHQQAKVRCESEMSQLQGR